MSSRNVDLDKFRLRRFVERLVDMGEVEIHAEPVPLTGLGVVNMIVTELAVIDMTPEGLVLREIAPGVTPEDVQKVTEPKLLRAPGLKTMSA